MSLLAMIVAVVAIPLFLFVVFGSAYAVYRRPGLGAPVMAAAAVAAALPPHDDRGQPHPTNTH